ncbi:hypothetical protein NKG94_09505 [Micromonospora sp. M12]
MAEAADRSIRSELGALRTDVFVADYRISGLWPVLDPDLPAAGFLASTPWRSAASAASNRFVTPPARALPALPAADRVGSGWACC